MPAVIRRISITFVVLAMAGCSAVAPEPRPAGEPGSSGALVPPTRPVATQIAPPDPSTVGWMAVPSVGDAFAGAKVGPIAVGPAGIVALGSDSTDTALIAWSSPNGVDWDRHWLPPTTFGGGIPSHLFASAATGYVAIGSDMAVDGTIVRVVWTSRDGIAWTEDPDPSGRIDGVVFAGVSSPAAILVLESLRNPGAALEVSQDGSHWLAAAIPNGGQVAGIAADVDGFVAWGGIQTALADGTVADRTVVWHSSTGTTWLEMPIDERPVLDDIQGWYSGGGQALIAGSDGWRSIQRNGTTTPAAGIPDGMNVAPGSAGIVAYTLPDVDACPRAIMMVGSRWVPTRAASGATCVPGPGVNPSRMVPLADGWLVLGQADRPSQIFGWLLRAGPAPEMAVGLVGGDPATAPDAAIRAADNVVFPRPDRCPAEPLDASAIATLSRADRVGCFGGRDLTLRAWVVDPGEGYGGTCPGRIPDWLQDCVLPVWLLRGTADNADPTAALHALRRPDATGDLSGVGRWVRLTGHFDDPAAATCADTIASGFVEDPVPLASLVRDCRTEFVVTRMANVR